MPFEWFESSGVTRLQWARVQVFQKGPLFPKKTLKKQRLANFGPPTALGPRALHALHALLLRHCLRESYSGIVLNVQLLVNEYFMDELARILPTTVSAECKSRSVRGSIYS